MKTSTMNTKRLLASVMMAALLIAGTSVTAFAAEDTASYGYLAGQQQNGNRHAGYVAAGSSDADSEAYKVANGIVGDKYSSAQHLECEALVAAGIIDQTTAEKIKEYASAKHDNIHARHSGMTGMTEDERHALYASFESDGFAGDSAEELLGAGVITKEQADAISAYLGQ